MPQEFEHFERQVNGPVRVFRNDRLNRRTHNLPMSKLKKRRPGWYVKEWLAFTGLRQADIVSRTDYNKSQVSEWVTGKYRWNEDVLNAFAHALGVEPGDLLKPPQAVPNELAAFLMGLDEKKRNRAIKILKTHFEDDEAA